MANLKILLTGELQRMMKYHILSASVAVALLWIGVLHFTAGEDVSMFFPLLIFVDVTSMAILMVGVTMFFEKQEGSFKSLLVAPINKWEYIISKALANISSNILTLFILYIYAIIFKEINVNILALFMAVVLIALFHTFIGFLLSYVSKDFTSLLMNMMGYFMLLATPVILEMVGVIRGELISKLMYLLPTKASMVLLRASGGGLESWEIMISLIYLIAVSIICYLLTLRRFDEYAIKESGV